MLAITHENLRRHPWVGRVSRGALLAVLSCASPAFAEDVDIFGPVRNERPGPRSSDQTLAFELRIGPYLPELSKPSPVVPSFPDELGRSHRIMVGVEADWQALRIPEVLNLGPGAGMGYTRLSNDGLYGNPPRAYSASLKIWTQWVWAVMRLDVLQQKYSIPFVFYGKLGAARASWWSHNRAPYNNSVDQADSGSAQGLAWALGAMFDLGFLEPERASRMDAISGVNHMYVFWEWYQFKLDDFGRGSNQVGDSTWTLGWAVDM